MTVRILHFGDVHLPLPPGALRTAAALHIRRIPAVVNYFLRRGRHYALGAQKLSALASFLRREPVDWVFYAGDSANMGLGSEFRAAAPKINEVLRTARHGAVAVPGNHDLYTRQSVEDFQRWMDLAGKTDMPGVRGPDGWPVVRFLGEETAVVAFRTAHPHLEFWNSSGHLTADAWERLRRVLDDPGIAGLERVFLLTHYPLDEPGLFHGMRGVRRIAELLAGRRNVVVLHGHNHVNYIRSWKVVKAEIPLYCCGSLTKAGVEAFWLHEHSDGRWIARRGRWTGEEWVLEG